VEVLEHSACAVQRDVDGLLKQEQRDVRKLDGVEDALSQAAVTA